jgi:hypothetical protein
MQSRPIGITIIAIILAISGVIQVIFGTEALNITNFGLAAADNVSNTTGYASIISGVLSILVAGGLFTTAGWAWLLTVVVLVIRIVADAVAILTHGAGSSIGGVAIANIVVSGILLLYFQRGNVKAAFGR